MMTVALLLLMLTVRVALIGERAASPSVPIVESAVRVVSTETASLWCAAPCSHVIVAPTAATTGPSPLYVHRPTASTRVHVAAPASPIVPAASASWVHARRTTSRILAWTRTRTRALVLVIHPALLLHRRRGRRLELRLNRRPAMLVWPIEALPLSGWELLWRSMMSNGRSVLSMLLLLLLLREELLRLLEGLRGGLLVCGLRYRLRYRLRGRLGDVRLLIRCLLWLVRAVLGLRRGRWGLNNRGRRLLVSLLGLLVLLALLLRLPVRAIAIICVEVRLVSGTSGSGGGSSGLLSWLSRVPLRRVRSSGRGRTGLLLSLLCGRGGCPICRVIRLCRLRRRRPRRKRRLLSIGRSRKGVLVHRRGLEREMEETSH